MDRPKFRYAILYYVASVIVPRVLNDVQLPHCLALIRFVDDLQGLLSKAIKPFCSKNDFHLQVTARLVDLRVSCRSGSMRKFPDAFPLRAAVVVVMRPAMAACRSFSRCTS